MSNVVAFRRAEAAVEQSPPCRPIRPAMPASATGAARRLWRRVRGTVEAFGWIVVAASIFAAIKG